jgi:hypothetical protein
MIKSKKITLIILITVGLSSCAWLKRTNTSTEHPSLSTNKRTYELADKAGKFVVNRESNYSPKDNRYFVKRQVLSNSDMTKLLEQSVVISNPGVLGKKVKTLRPFASEYYVWFDGKKYATEMKIDTASKSMIVKMKSPERQWNGEKRIGFPKDGQIFCFYSQVIECANTSGFITKAIKAETGAMNFYIIWEGYPYFQEQYLNVPDGVFTRASLTYDGTSQEGEKRFSLNFGDQAIFYFLDKDLQVSKIFWIAQGMSMSLRSK